jgi:hypothetical protein
MLICASGFGCVTGNPEVIPKMPVKSGFYETVAGVNICFCFSFLEFCFSRWLRRMLFSAGFLFALRVSRDSSVPFGVQ